ncbi:MAG: hypothetical protein R2873_05640 [Caldilineaceae bacterium]
MNPILQALLLSWDLRLGVILSLGVLEALHIHGWRTLRRRGRTLCQRLAVGVLLEWVNSAGGGAYVAYRRAEQ